MFKSELKQTAQICFEVLFIWSCSKAAHRNLLLSFEWLSINPFISENQKPIKISQRRRKCRHPNCEFTCLLRRWEAKSSQINRSANYLIRNSQSRIYPRNRALTRHHIRRRNDYILPPNIHCPPFPCIYILDICARKEKWSKIRFHSNPHTNIFSFWIRMKWIPNQLSENWDPICALASVPLVGCAS